MSRRRSVLIFWGLALALAVLTAAIAFNYVDSLQREAGEEVSALVAAEDIPANTLITKDMVEPQSVSERFLERHAPSYISSLGEVAALQEGSDGVPIGESFITAVPLSKGSILQRDLIYSSSRLSPGMRAVAIGVNQITSVGNSIIPGSRVDVVVSNQEEAIPGQKELKKTVVLLQDVPVLAVGSMESPGMADIPVVGGMVEGMLPSGQMPKSATVTLALSPEDAVRLIYMDNFAKEVRLVLRRNDERETPLPTPITQESFR